MKNGIAHRYTQYLHKKLGAIKADPHQIAAGSAVGFLVGTLPIFTLRIGIALGLSYYFKWSKPATLFGIFLINPLTGPLYYALAYTVGHFLLGGEEIASQNWDVKYMLNAIWSDGTFFLILFFGCFIVAIPISLFLFWSVRKTITHLQTP